MLSILQYEKRWGSCVIVSHDKTFRWICQRLKDKIFHKNKINEKISFTMFVVLQRCFGEEENRRCPQDRVPL